MKKLSLMALLVVLAACKGQQVEGEAIHARVVLASAVPATCVLFEVRDASSHSVIEKRWLPRTDDELQIAIFRGALPKDVELAARPYQDGNCQGGLEARTQNGPYVTGTASFVEGTVTQASPLSLTPGTDGDSDGYVAPGAGGADCNDSSGAVNPSKTEVCSDQDDLNCDGKKGCEASTCSAISCIGPPTALALTLPTSPVQAGTASCTSGTVQVQDANGSNARVSAATSVGLQESPTAAIAFFSNSTCTTPATSVSINAGEGSAAFYFQGKAVGNVTVTASSTGLTSAAKVVQIIPGPGNQLVFTTPARAATAGACSAQVQVQSQDAQGNAAPVTVATTLSLSASPSTGFKFYSDASCANEVASVTLNTGSSTASFYFRGTKAGGVTVTVTAPSFTGNSQVETINPGPPAAIVLTGPSSTQAGNCSTAVTVELRDNQGNPTTATANTTINLSGSGVPLTFSTNSGCTPTATSVVVPMGSGTATFFYRGTQAGNATITGMSGSLTSGTLPVAIGAGPGTKLVFTTGVQTLTAGSCSLIATVQLQDTFSNPTTVTSDTPVGVAASPPDGFLFFTDASCTGAGVTVVNMPASSGSVSFYFKGTRSGAATLSASSLGVTTATQGVTINPAPPTLLALSPSPLTVTAGVCTQVTLQARDTFGNGSPVSGNQTINLTANPTAGFTFSTASNCSGPVTSVTINNGQSSPASLYVRGNTAGSVTVTATHTVLTTGTLAVTVNPAAPSKVVFKTSAQTVQVGSCSNITTVEIQDSLNNASPVAAGATVTLSSSPGSLTFYTDSGCTVSTPSVTVPASQSSASFYFKGSAPAPTVTITAASNGLADGTQAQNITPLPPDALAFTTIQQVVSAGGCSGVVTVEARAQGGATPVTSPLVVDLTASPATGFTFYSNPSCTTAVTQVTINTSQTSTNFYYIGTKAGTVSISASSGVLTPVMQNANIIALAPSKVAFSTPSYSTVAGACSSIVTIQSVDTHGNVSAVAADTTVNLSGSGTPGDPNFRRYSDSNCMTVATTATFLSGTSSASFYYRGEVARTVTLTAGGGTSGFTNGNQDHMVIPANASALSFSTSTPAQTMLASTCALRTVQSRDSFNNLALDALTLTLGPSPQAEFFSDVGCTVPVSQVSIPMGSSSASFYFKGLSGGINANATLALTASSGGLTPASQTETLIPNVRNGTCVLSGGAKSILCPITPNLLNPNRAFVTFQATSSDTGSDRANVRCRVNNVAELACDRGAGGATTNIRWSVAEFPSGVVTQHPVLACGGDTSTATFASAVRAQSFLLLSSERDVAGQGSIVSRLGELISSTQAEVRKTGGCANGDTNNLVVVDYPGASVQRAVASIAGGATSTTVGLSPSVALNRSILVYSYAYTGTGTKICDRAVRGELTNTTTVTFSRGEGDTANCAGMNITGISWEVIEFPVGTLVQQFTQPIGVGATSATITLPQAVDRSRTFVIAGGQWASGQVHGEGSYFGGETIAEMRAQAELTDSTHVSLTRESSLGSAKFTVFVVQLKP